MHIFTRNRSVSWKSLFFWIFKSKNDKRFTAWKMMQSDLALGRRQMLMDPFGQVQLWPQFDRVE